MHGTACARRADAQADLFEYIEVFYNRVAATPRWATAHRFGSLRTGSVSMSISPPRQHENGLLEDEIRWAPHTVPSLMFGDWLGPSCLMWDTFHDLSDDRAGAIWPGLDRPDAQLWAQQ